MKYIITDKNEVRVGIGSHISLAEGTTGKVTRAGHCSRNPDGTYRVWGESIGYNINATSEDAQILNDSQAYDDPNDDNPLREVEHKNCADAFPIGETD